MSGPNFKHRVGWLFADPSNGTTHEWEINPSSLSSSPRRKKVAYNPSPVPGGNLNAFEGEQEAVTNSASGTVLTEAQYDSMIEWFSKRRLLTLRDEYGITYTIYITKFIPKRVRNQQYPWRHEYTFEYVITG